MKIYFLIEITHALAEVVFAGGKPDAPYGRESKNAHARLISATPTMLVATFIQLSR